MRGEDALLYVAVGSMVVAFATAWGCRVGTIVAAAVTVLVLVAMIGYASAHDAPSGWSYPRDCCSAVDCYPVPESALRVTPDGLEVVETGEVLPYSSSKIKNSGDYEYHRCSAAGDPEMNTICVFVPGGS